MLVISRVIHVDRARRRAVGRANDAPARHRTSVRCIAYLRTVLMVVCGLGSAAAAGWVLAGGSLPPVQPLGGHAELVAADTSDGRAPVHLDSTPRGAAVRIDGTSSGQTPLDTWLSPGQHTLGLEQANSLAEQQTIDVADGGSSVHIDLWQRQPQVVPVRPVYPGAFLKEAAFLNDGQLVVSVAMPDQAATSSASTQLWRMDPSTGHFSRVDVPGLQTAPIVMALAPDGDQLAYVLPGSSATTTASGWSTTSANPPSGAASQTSRPESIWLAPLDASQPPRHVFYLPSLAAP